MKIVVIGGGPAGLYFAYLMRRDGGGHDIRIFERNPSDATFGFGVVFSDRALGFLKAGDRDTYGYLKRHMESWPDFKVVLGGEAVPIDGNGFSAIGRLKLLGLLQARCEEASVEVQFERPLRSVDEVADADLVVGADGVNSLVRRSHAEEFRTRRTELSNRFAWYGTTKAFDCLTLTYRENAHGVFCAHHYRYAPAMSTFIVECDAATWRRAGLDTMGNAEARAYCERVFAPELDGHRLISNRSVWRRFPVVRNHRWWTGNKVLLGDALRTAHFSIGSGTRLAMEDAIALAAALKEHGRDLPAALARYQATRQPAVEALVSAATASARWYERMADLVRLEPYEFAHAYMTRTGRVSDQRLERIAPDFMRRYQARRAPRRASGGRS
ncbi:MAG: FAD-dependent monooxygenase [Kiloniellales bacterium]